MAVLMAAGELERLPAAACLPPRASSISPIRCDAGIEPASAAWKPCLVGLHGHPMQDFPLGSGLRAPFWNWGHEPVVIVLDEYNTFRRAGENIDSHSLPSGKVTSIAVRRTRFCSFYADHHRVMERLDGARQPLYGR